MTVSLSQIEVSLLLLSTIVAALTFAFNSWRNWNLNRQEEIRAWQKTVVSEIFLQNPDQEFSFQEILNRYQSEAPSFSKYKLRDNDLSRQTLRRITVELLADKLIEYYRTDRYKVYIAKDFWQDNSGLAEIMTTAMSGALGKATESDSPFGGNIISEFLNEYVSSQENLENEIINQVQARNRERTAAELAIAVAERLGGDMAKVRAQIAKMLSKGELYETTDGKIGLRVTKGSEAE